MGWGYLTCKFRKLSSFLLTYHNFDTVPDNVFTENQAKIHIFTPEMITRTMMSTLKSTAGVCTPERDATLEARIFLTY